MEVDGYAIGYQEFDAAVHIAARQQFFHRNVDESKIEELRINTARDLIDRLLLLNAAKRAKVEVDAVAVRSQVEVEAKRYRVGELSEDHRKKLLALLEEQVEEKLLLRGLEQQVRSVAEPDAQSLQWFYEKNLDKFTTPSQSKVSVILLKVAPSSTSQVWQAAHEEAEKLLVRIEGGADFGELASIHSGDSSAEASGDLGFVHQGMLSADAQQVVDGLEMGQVSKPVALLQGIAIFKLTDRRPAEVNSFERVKQRAASLLKRERSEVAWDGFIQNLRARAKIVVHDVALKEQIMNGYVSAAK